MHKIISIDYSNDELIVIDMMAQKAQMTRSEYIRSCVADYDGELAPMLTTKFEGHSIKVPVRMPIKVVEKARIQAKRLNMKLRKWMRLRSLATPSAEISKRFASQSKKRPGRPTEAERCKRILDESSLSKLQILMLSPEKARDCLQNVFSILSKAGVEQGDEEALYEVCKRVLRYETRQVVTGRKAGPNESSPTRREVVVVGISPRYGSLEIVEPSLKDRAKKGEFWRAQKGRRPG